MDAAETDHPGHQFRSGVVLAIAGTFLFALKSIFIKLAFAEGVDPTTLLALRMFASLPLYVAVLIRISYKSTGKRPPAALIVRSVGLGFLGYYLASYLDMSGLAYISAQLERLTLFTYPAIVAVLAWLFLGEKLGIRIVVALLLSYVGIVLMYSQERLIVDSNDATWGVLLVLGSALSYACYVMFAKPTMQKIGSRVFTSWAMIGSTGFVGVHFGLTHSPNQLVELPPIVYAYTLVLAVVCTVIPSYMVSEAIVRIGATRTTVIGTVGPVLTMLLAIFVLHEASSWQHAAGMLVAIAGVSLVAKK